LPEHDLALLVDAARRAGQIALRYWGKSPKVWDKGDQGPVTEADIAVNDMLEASLRAARPGYGWLSEESPDDRARLQCEHVFIVDPIDGTRAFIAADPGFCHALAIARNGAVTAAVVYLPAKDRLYTASVDTPACRDGSPVTLSSYTDPDGASLLTARNNLDPEHWIGPPPAARRSVRPSLANRLCLVADGTCDAMLTLRPTWEWDIAAGSLIAARAGATVTDRHATALRFNSAHPQTNGLVVAPPDLHAAFVARLKPNPAAFPVDPPRKGPGG